jgi:hypothetical protein
LRDSAAFDYREHSAHFGWGGILAARIGVCATRERIARTILLCQWESMGYSNRMGRKVAGTVSRLGGLGEGAESRWFEKDNAEARRAPRIAEMEVECRGRSRTARRHGGPSASTPEGAAPGSTLTRMEGRGKSTDPPLHKAQGRGTRKGKNKGEPRRGYRGATNAATRL